MPSKHVYSCMSAKTYYSQTYIKYNKLNTQKKKRKQQHKIELI